MNSSLCSWLADVEDSLWRMVLGVFRFTFLRLPEWIYRTLVDVIGPATVRFTRVLIAFSLWLTVLIVPAQFAYRLPSWGGILAFTWVCVALVGSAWGRSQIARKSRPLGSEAAGRLRRVGVDGLASHRASA
jgi:hypothetical protein